MPPKQIAGAPAGGSDGAVTALCHMIMSCEDFKTDSSKLAPVLGVSHAKNVPRKINGIINPYGFEFKGGKIIQSGSQAPVATTGPGNNTSASENGKGDKNTTGSADLKPKRKARQTAGPNKRMHADDSDDENNSKRVKEEDGGEV